MAVKASSRAAMLFLSNVLLLSETPISQVKAYETEEDIKEQIGKSQDIKALQKVA